MNLLSDFSNELRAKILEIGSNSPVELQESEFNTLALRLFRLQFERNSAYRAYAKAQGKSPARISSWRQIPPVPAAGFKDVELSCLPPQERSHVFHSSGTTQSRPSRHFHNDISLSLYSTSAWEFFRIRFAEPLSRGCSVKFLMPTQVKAPNSSLVHMCEVIRRRTGGGLEAFLADVTVDGGWQVNMAKTLRALSLAADSGAPVLLLGTAFSFVQLLDELARHHLELHLPDGSWVMETGGYKGRSRVLPKPVLHASISGRLGVAADHIVSEYGMSELSSQAYDHLVGAAGDRVFRFPPWARAQVISPESGEKVGDGETGLIRVHDLANVFSVAAVQTEDLGIKRDGGIELLGRASLAEPKGCSLMSVDAM